MSRTSATFLRTSAVAMALLGLAFIPTSPVPTSADAEPLATDAEPLATDAEPLATDGADAGTTSAVATASHGLDPTLEPLRGRPSDGAYTPERSDFTVEVDGEPVLYGIMATIVLPGSELEVAAPGAAGGTHRLVYGAGEAREEASGRWIWTVPDEPGIHALQIEEIAGGRSVHLNALVAHPRAHVTNDVLHGYRIGRYRETPLRGDPVYLPPEAFVEVAAEDEDVLVTPHFTLGQFLCKQPGEPRFVSLTLPLLRKLEVVLEATNEAGIHAPTFHVMSGYRTPAYNRAIGNTTDYSRHLWGDAADIFVDVDGNGDMDDLNGDGRSDLSDARLLYRIVESVERDHAGHVHAGGLGLYRRNAAHGPFVHVDARGTPARW